MTDAAKVINGELRRWDDEGPDDTSVETVDGNIFQWDVTIYGPSETPYEGGTFHVQVNFPADYPTSAPTIKFITPIYHTNVRADGNVCFLELTNWTRANSIGRLFRSLVQLFIVPRPDNGANPEAIEVMQYALSITQIFNTSRLFLKHSNFSCTIGMLTLTIRLPEISCASMPLANFSEDFTSILSMCSISLARYDFLSEMINLVTEEESLTI